MRSRAESWWVASRAGFPSWTEPRSDPKHQAEPSEQDWALSQATSTPETLVNPQLSDEQGPDLSLSRAPIWAEPTIELIP